MDKKVTAYIEKQKSPQKEILHKLRETITQAFPGIHERIKWGVPYYAGKCYLLALGDHVNLGFYLEGAPKELEKLLEGSGKTMKHIRVYSVSDIDKKGIVNLLKMVE